MTEVENMYAIRDLYIGQRVKKDFTKIAAIQEYQRSFIKFFPEISRVFGDLIKGYIRDQFCDYLEMMMIYSLSSTNIIGSIIGFLFEVYKGYTLGKNLKNILEDANKIANSDDPYDRFYNYGRLTSSTISLAYGKKDFFKELCSSAWDGAASIFGAKKKKKKETKEDVKDILAMWALQDCSPMLLMSSDSSIEQTNSIIDSLK
eukprot:CAMPEP_0170514798 /NCGR_PEP_ID=MMETSP0209-20121228/1345_1 /TAXON_ID=665100 ORGANISM="Litonotus pictus, Strain P1" /NCGR_SAMPLE_ID=MMETSP0209 /ASSEMBLY_ACC=CAM_ASM_000301 /LENGTH=202 /DNA_ID=CAMNT_0010799023 /DNA_START=6 /DNA_END=614 /DNA_ORIENTATION=-